MEEKWEKQKMDCSAFIQSEDTLEFIVAQDEQNRPQIAPKCMQMLNEQYSIWYYDASLVPPLSIERYSYTSIPKVFWLMDSTSLEVSGILALQNQPTFSLRGEGVLVGVIDTGIDYTNPLFRNEDGSTRILAIWDQTQERKQPESMSNQAMQRFRYGVIYERSQIDEALEMTNPRDLVPVTDENGHGTFLASVAAGSMDEENDFVGAAPDSELVVVKLKPAKQKVREFFYFPEDEPLYMESDIMAAIAFLHDMANQENRPLAILLGMGSNQGSHAGTSPLAVYADSIGSLRGRAIVFPAGNEAVAQHHFYGEATSVLNPVVVEINIEENIAGFCMELWSFAPEQVRVVVQSPTGQQSKGEFPISDATQTTNFVFENTLLTINYRVAGRGSGDLLVFFRFERPSTGIWTILVYPQNAITGAFHMWLPIQKEVGSDITFIRPNPDTTITVPSDASVPISVGGYEGFSGIRYLFSGRGYDANGDIKPEFCAPCVEVFGAGLRNNYISDTGTSVAAAITAGAVALCLEWGIVRKNAPSMNCVEVKNLLIRGCNREGNKKYPNQECGYGAMDVYRSFQVLRE